MTSTSPLLIETLGLAQRFGFLGAAPIEEVVAHARRFVDAVPDDAARVIDVGAGGGTPGLVIAHDRADLEVVLLDRRAKRTDFLVRAVARLGWAGRVTVLTGDAGRLARRSELRGSFDVAVARGLGAPPVTAELTRGFVRAGGSLIVSEPPDGPGERWPSDPLGRLGWTLDDVGRLGVAVLRAVGPPPSPVPRSGAIPSTWT